MTDTTTKRFLVEQEGPPDTAFTKVCTFLDNPPSPDRDWAVLGVIEQFTAAVEADVRMAGWFADLPRAHHLVDGDKVFTFQAGDGVAVLRRWVERYEELVTVASPLLCLLDRLVAEHTQCGVGQRSDHWRGIDFADGYDAGIEFAAEQIRAAINEGRI